MDSLFLMNKSQRRIRRTVHRASGGIVDLHFTKASSYAEAVVRSCEIASEKRWTAAVLRSEEAEHDNQRLFLTSYGPVDTDEMIARLNLEAAQVVEIEQRTPPDLSRLTDKERAVYAAVLLYGPIKEAGINRILYDDPMVGDCRKEAKLLERFRVFVQSGDGYQVRDAGHIVNTDSR